MFVCRFRLCLCLDKSKDRLIVVKNRFSPTDPKMAHIAQLRSEILTIATDVLQKPIVLVNVNDLLIQRILQEKDPSKYVFLPSSEGFTDTSKVGVFTREKRFEPLFDGIGAGNKAHGNKVTVIVYWSVWMWYGTYRSVNKSLQSFFKDRLTQDPNDPLTCTICLEASETMYMEYVFNCSHLFCTKCIPKLLKINSICPLCRANKL